MGISVLAPFPPHDYLEYVYGKNWSIPKKIEDDVQLYTNKYLRRSFLRIILKRIYLKIKIVFVLTKKINLGLFLQKVISLKVENSGLLQEREATL